LFFQWNRLAWRKRLFEGGVEGKKIRVRLQLVLWGVSCWLCTTVPHYVSLACPGSKQHSLFWAWWPVMEEKPPHQVFLSVAPLP
jgi:hypothetical protein